MRTPGAATGRIGAAERRAEGDRMDAQASFATAVDTLSRTFLGRLIAPGDPEYDRARRVHNGLVDRRPALVARCQGTADVVDAVRLARELSYEIAVRGGGHNVAGRSTVDGGLLVDLSAMRAVHVDPAARRAVVQGGARWRDVNRETQLHGLATTGGVVGSTGVGGLTLGGGLGWLMSKYGMALDNLEGVTLVLADGRVVRASATEEPDLFWAVRGGGGNFGVATSFEFRLHEVGPVVFGGLVAFPFAEAAGVLRQWRDLTQSAPDDVMLVAALLTSPDGHKIVGVGACHLGAEAEGQELARTIKSFGTVAMDALGPIPYAALNGMLDASFPEGALNYWKSHFVPSLDDRTIDTIVEGFASCPSPAAQALIEHFHGAATRVPVAATAFALRDAGYNVLFLGQWMDQADGGRTAAWTRTCYDALQAFVGPRRYLNYLGDDDHGIPATLAAAYGSNLPRLRALKRTYDPENVFHLNVNIEPA
jgi:FAD/FMN-containing dehydrogenase